MRVVTIVGARPQFVKACVISRALKERDIAEVLVHTGQHYDAQMSRIFFDELQLPAPTYNLGIHGGTHGEMTGRMLGAIESILIEQAPDMLIVIGDTNSTLAGALAASKLHVPIAHIESGLRSFNRRMPEEVNRIVSDHLSTLLFCSTRAGVANLAQEGIAQGVHLVGDVMMDATLLVSELAERRSHILAALGLPVDKYSVATIHRAENTDDPTRLRAVFAWLEEQGRKCPVVMPLHPRTKAALERDNLALSAVRAIEPVGYLDMQCLLANCANVFTDSGGLQKEAYFHRKPCVTLRDETEWVETVDAGWNRLWRTPDYAPRREIDEYGGGIAAQSIAALLAGYEA